MYKYTCSNENCGWTGDKHEVERVWAHQFMQMPEPADSEEEEHICVCPKCEPYQLAYEEKLY